MNKIDIVNLLCFTENFPSSVLNILHLHPFECAIWILTGVLYLILANIYTQFILANIKFYKDFIGSINCSIPTVSIYCLVSMVFIALTGLCDFIIYYFISINQESILFSEISKVIVIFYGIYTAFNLIIKPIFYHIIKVKVTGNKG